ncbi:MAG: energy-coupling factor transporter transmembrane protein EcfT [Propionibacteriaceae bacterium]|jgi:biotin transport system permease protein|nr:energy-coupling factor transporter transmembrane protein EcfT [Propionibacteriaceae bacterium]
MAKADRWFGTYHPLGSAVERWSVGVKYALLLGLSLPCFIIQRWPLTSAALLAAAGLLLAAKLRARQALGLAPGFFSLVVVLAVFHAVTGDWLGGLVVAGNLVLALWAARLVTMTTPASLLIDALVTVARPFSRLGLQPERFGLAVHIMLRSLPRLSGALAGARQAAAARGLRGHVGRQVTQVAVQAVGYAQATGDAMTARGLGDGER